ncbi:glycosyltransferase family 61 protein [Pontiella agarivorans]|uniref:Glycosyltransferase family 61 protein n=1 Tax=Pontiella agarivorans TaxID=3038953 RepID=A0ABU5N062_9BACT|nr:glycosyltransferase family 61 protein [Pontiella agarivorans]MDZ8119826.1 glycosyltransferase family 61 protein [Pontiella agarivorans]
MSYLEKYKTGSCLFRTLSEARMRLQAARNALRYSYPAPVALIGVHDSGNDGSYKKCTDSSPIPIENTSVVIPAEASRILETHTPATYPESFIFRLHNGHVLGDGTVVTPKNKILSESTTDFHRKQKYHHLIYERRVPAPERFNGRLAVITSPGSDNYFHWTLASLPRLNLLNDMDDEIDAYYIDCSSRFHQEWISMLGISENKIIAAAPNRHIEADELIVPSFAGLPSLPTPAGLDFLRNFIPPHSKGRRLYISRAGARRRRILNEEVLPPVLQKYAFETIEPGRMTVKQQMETFASASVIIAPHGAELTNLAFCSAGTQVIEMFSPYYLNPCFKQLAAVRGLRHTALVGKGGTRVVRKQLDAHHVWANINIDALALETALATML